MTLKEKYHKLLQDAKAIAEVAVTEDRSLTVEEKTRISNIMEDAKKLKDSMQMIAEINAMDAEVSIGEEQKKQKFSGSLADQFLGSDTYKNWFKSIAPNGRIPENLKGITSPPVEIKKFGLFKKDLITGLDPTSAGAFVTPDDTGIYEPIGRYPTVLRNLIAIRQTTSDTVEFVRQTVQVTEAAPTPEANVKYPTGYTGEIPGTKPQGKMNFERVAETVKTIAVYVGATKRALSDAAQIRGIIDQELREDLVDSLENQLFNGNGAGENFTGLANQPGTLLQAFNADILTTTRQAVTTLRVTGRQMPTAWVFNPADWETVELLQDDENRYYYGGPQNQGPPRLWGIPVVESFHVAAGAAWLANWRKAVLWDREQASITMTDSHDDWFIRNMIAVLAEMRAAFGLIRPSAFVQVELS